MLNYKTCQQHNWKLSWNIHLSIYLSNLGPNIFYMKRTMSSKGACLLWSPTFSEKRMKFEKIWRWSRICGNSSSTQLIYQRRPTHLSEKTDYFPNNINFGSWTSYTPAPFYSRVCQIRTAELSCQTLTTASAPSKIFMASALTKHTKKFTSQPGNIYLSKMTLKATSLSQNWALSQSWNLARPPWQAVA